MIEVLEDNEDNDLLFNDVLEYFPNNHEQNIMETEQRSTEERPTEPTEERQITVQRSSRKRKAPNSSQKKTSNSKCIFK